jgi:hypothetical protein
MASRETYSFRRRIKYTKTIKKKLKTIIDIIRDGIKRKYIRKLIIKDNISTPFHKLVTCKIRPHDYFKISDEDYCFCLRCSHVIVTKDYEQYIRSEKIKKIVKKSKKRKL